MTSRIDIAESAFVHPSAQLYGHVTVGEGASVWCNAVVRAETAHVEIGAFSNIQDFCMIHTDPGKPVRIGRHCSITHHTTLHGCTIEDLVLIGINSTIYNGAVIGAGSIVGQHAYVRDGTIVPPNSIVVGSPAKVIRTADSRLANRINAEFYVRNGAAYSRGEHRAWDGPDFESWFGDLTKRLAREYS
jgi:carbonic anhydrase/acetyltransferase-like protein (isoleucine patch superfamily)